MKKLNPGEASHKATAACAFFLGVYCVIVNWIDFRGADILTFHYYITLIAVLTVAMGVLFFWYNTFTKVVMITICYITGAISTVETPHNFFALTFIFWAIVLSKIHKFKWWRIISSIVFIVYMFTGLFVLSPLQLSKAFVHSIVFIVMVTYSIKNDLYILPKELGERLEKAIFATDDAFRNADD